MRWLQESDAARDDRRLKWHKWFAWRPVLITHRFSWQTGKYEHINSYDRVVWVWLAVVERSIENCQGYNFYSYRELF